MEPDGLPAGLAGRLGAAPGVVEPSLRCPAAPPLGVWPALPLPDVLPEEEPEAAVPPPDAARSVPRSHPARSAPLSANKTAATHAVIFMLTSIVVMRTQRSN